MHASLNSTYNIRDMCVTLPQLQNQIYRVKMSEIWDGAQKLTLDVVHLIRSSPCNYRGLCAILHKTAIFMVLIGFVLWTK